MLDHEVSQVVRCERVFGWMANAFWLEGLGLLPIAHDHKNAAPRDDKSRASFWRNCNGSLIVRNRLIKLSK